ncbi:APC family permease [Mycolicibacterium sp. P9-64]|uniref:APC family permease n=1 Tax=Mycolicibacterium sp. P9-64 TaxID=2024612 RepID=UPI0011EF8EA9|nr:APC family permease [Mycolicibacterium sp. P9-64]KAA0084554.1 APC family permease [Mycolicibacterium sp. P9-64]
MTTNERSHVEVAAKPALEHEHASLASVTVLGLSAQQLGPGLALCGGYMFVYAGRASWLCMLIALIAGCTIGATVTVFARRYVASGSLMSYVGRVLGDRSRTIVGAGYVMGILIAIAAVVTGVVVYTSSFLADLGVSFAAEPWVQAVSAVVVAALAGGLAYRGLDASVKVTLVLTFVGIPVILFVTGAAVVKSGTAFAGQLTLSGGGIDLSTIVVGTLVALSYYVGFEGLAAMAAETKAPLRNVPRLVVLILSMTGLPYIVMILLQVPALEGSIDALAEGESPTTILAHVGNVGFLSGPLDLILAGATFAGLVATMNYGSRILATASANGLLPRPLARVHPRFKSPNVAIAVMTVIGFALPVGLQLTASAPPLVSSSYLYTLFSYFYFIPYVIAAVAAIVLLVREGRPNLLLATFIGLGGVFFATALIYPLVLPSDGVIGALPWIMLALTALTYAGFVIARRRHPVEADSLADAL